MFPLFARATRIAVCLVAVGLLSACASGLQVRSDEDPGADFASYRTWNFFDELGIEGGYSDHPADPGGRTLYGIAERYYPDAWRDGPPTLEQARAIYRRDFWDRNRLGNLASHVIAEEVFEAGVNVGPATAARWLQTVYNAARPRGWVQLKVDGAVGPKTLTAVNRLLRLHPRKEQVVLTLLNCYQGVHYAELGKPEFLDGWVLRRVVPER